MVCVCVGGTERHTLRASLSPNLHVFINTEAVEALFGGFYGGVITQAQLIKSLAVGDGVKLQSPKPPGIRGWY